MRRVVLLPLFALSLTATPARAEDPAAAPPAAPAAPASDAAASLKNVSFSAALGFADNTKKAGKVVGLERTVDVYGEAGWTSEAKDLVLEVEVGTTEKSIPWTSVKTLTITPAATSEFSCEFTSDTDPHTYSCTLPTTSAVVMKDGTKGNVVTRNRWRFTYEDGSTVEFSAHKLTARAPDDRQLGFGDADTENAELYAKLQAEVRSQLKGKLVRSVAITP
jgi:hypothetical protein